LTVNSLGVLFLQKNNPLAKNIRLVVAGGYDPLVAENVDHLEELKQLAEGSVHWHDFLVLF
jgi:hypothetical protein